ncbi:hypothetical protein HU200_005060 [Digitaria exilis]|uniref:Uncharacterized protein n=1 Tax=Digitaria exilis TaxID=1010633 RepID=A0A835KUJ5_9POAL|nr:hypothetical protein HU200_005060 [Digitaria exilis]
MEQARVGGANNVLTAEIPASFAALMNLRVGNEQKLLVLWCCLWLVGAGLVCRSWLEAAKVPELWRSVFIIGQPEMDDDVMCAMAKVAVDRYGGQLEKFVGKDFGTDEILKYIGDRYMVDVILRKVHQHHKSTFQYIFFPTSNV